MSTSGSTTAAAAGDTTSGKEGSILASGGDDITSTVAVVSKEWMDAVDSVVVLEGNTDAAETPPDVEGGASVRPLDCKLSLLPLMSDALERWSCNDGVDSTADEWCGCWKAEPKATYINRYHMKYASHRDKCSIIFFVV